MRKICIDAIAYFFTEVCSLLFTAYDVPLYILFCCIRGLRFKMHSSLPKSIEVLSFYIIETNDWTVDSKAMFKNVFLYLNVFSSDEMQHSCILHSQYMFFRFLSTVRIQFPI